MAEFTTENGVDINIRIAPFEDAMELKSAISKELADAGFNFDGISITGETDVAELMPLLIKAVLALDSSPRVNNAIFKCLERCTYDGEKIRKSTFEDISARENYYQIVIECLKENLRPFFKSRLAGLLETYLSENLPK